MCERERERVGGTLGYDSYLLRDTSLAGLLFWSHSLANRPVRNAF